jgi:hypothetical protein
MPKGQNSDSVNMKTSFNNANQFYPQSNRTILKGGSLVDQIADKPNGDTSLSTLISVWMIILAVCTAMYI